MNKNTVKINTGAGFTELHAEMVICVESAVERKAIALSDLVQVEGYGMPMHYEIAHAMEQYDEAVSERDCAIADRDAAQLREELGRSALAKVRKELAEACAELAETRAMKSDLLARELDEIEELKCENERLKELVDQAGEEAKTLQKIAMLVNG